MTDLERACEALLGAIVAHKIAPRATANALGTLLVETMRQLGFSRAEIVEFVAAHYDHNVADLKRSRTQ